MYFTPATMLGTLALATISLYVMVIVRRIWFHPLSSYPGPWIGRFTELWDFYGMQQHARTFRHHDMLQRHGNGVRIGTNHLIFSDLQSWSDIYGPSSSPCMKDPSVYHGFSVLGNPNLLSSTDRHVHARLRRLFAHAFSLRGLASSEPIIAEKVQQYVDCTMETSCGQDIDILPKTQELYLDIVSWLSFGQSFDCLRGKTPTARGNIASFFFIVPLLAFVPFLRHIPLPAIREGLAGLNRLIDFAATHVDAYLERSGSDPDEAVSDGTLLGLGARAVDSETSSKLSRTDLVEHSILFLTAGSGTTSATLTFLLWEVGRNEAIRARLAEEIRMAFPDTDQMPTYEVASKLTYLKCVIAETLRLWGPLNGSAPRVSPGKTICGRWVPKGTIVETCAYTSARDARFFPDALTYNPSRWETATPEMKKMSRPFSYGPRNCIGQNLADMALTLTVARIYQLYDVIPALSMTPDVVQQEDKGVLEPKMSGFYVKAFKRDVNVN